MQITLTEKLSEIRADELAGLYGNRLDFSAAFEKSYLTVFARDGQSLIGAARVLSEGVETALLVDLKTVDGYDFSVKKAILNAIEAKLNDRRVMVFGCREDLPFWEELGYGRCKNAWTYFRPGFDERDFLPAGYQYENEFWAEKRIAKAEPKNTVITYQAGYSESALAEINELLTRAFWGRPHDVQKTREAFSRSQYVVTAYDGSRLVGIARAVSDQICYATILNVAVDPDYQGLSIGRTIVQKLSEMIEAEVVVLNTHPGAVGFYNRMKEYRRNKYVFEKPIRSGGERPPEFSQAMFTPKGYRFPEEYEVTETGSTMRFAPS